MTQYSTLHHEHHEEEVHSKTLLGFWIYLMSDCILFGTLFAAYAVLHNNTFGGLGAKELFSLPFALSETMILLTSSFTCGLAMVAAHREQKNKVLAWYGITFLLGVAFLALELYEFHHLYVSGNSWHRSGFLSAYFTLVGTHGLHITLGLLWIIVFAWQVFKRGVTPVVLRRLTCLGMFWHFLDIVWIFIFTIVYLMGAL